jgi:Ni/Co efflux regulator RcnB
MERNAPDISFYQTSKQSREQLMKKLILAIAAATLFIGAPAASGNMSATAKSVSVQTDNATEFSSRHRYYRHHHYRRHHVFYRHHHYRRHHVFYRHRHFRHHRAYGYHRHYRHY